MLDIFLSGILDITLLLIYAFVGFIAFMLIQGVIYWTTGFSVYNYLKRKFILEQLIK